MFDHTVSRDSWRSSTFSSESKKIVTVTVEYVIIRKLTFNLRLVYLCMYRTDVRVKYYILRNVAVFCIIAIILDIIHRTKATISPTRHPPAVKTHGERGSDLWRL